MKLNLTVSSPGYFNMSSTIYKGMVFIDRIESSRDLMSEREYLRKTGTT